MAGTGKRLHDVEEAHDALNQCWQGGAPVVTGDGIVHCFPQSLDDIDPRVVDRLEQQLELAVLGKPAARRAALVDDVVVEDEDDSFGAAIAPAQVFEQVDERNGPRKLDRRLSEILLGFQAASAWLAWSKYTASGVRRSSAL